MSSLRVMGGPRPGRREKVVCVDLFEFSTV